MTLQQMLNDRKAEIRKLQERIKELNADIAAIEKVIAISGTEEVSAPAVPATPKRRMKDTYGTFAKFIAQFLIENGLTHKELGKLIGVTGTCIGQWVNGKSAPRGTKLFDVSSKLAELSANEYTASDIMTLLQ